MNSDGEKMPPDAPEPRLIEVAASFADKQSASSGSGCQAAEQDRLDRRIADAFDVIMAGIARNSAYIIAPTSSMPMRMAQIADSRSARTVLGAGAGRA